MSQDDTILIVGGAGYIGSHTTLALKEAGYSTVVYDNFSSGYRNACFGDHLVEGDLDDIQKLQDTLKNYKIDCVIHFAALIEAGQSVTTPLPFFQNNVGGSFTLLQAMLAEDVKKLVFSSTAATYGNRDDLGLLAETLPPDPINPYGDSKAMVEKALEACVSAHDFQAIALRFFNAAGADAQGRTGERHIPETHLIPLIIEAARGIRSHINIFGTDYETPDGTCIRDYVHVSDLATGHVAAVRHLLDNNAPMFSPINLGTGKGQSVREVINSVRRISNNDFAVLEVERRPGDPAMLVADVSKAQAVLGWSAKHSDIDTIVRDAWNYATETS